MLNILKQGASTIISAAQDLAQELNNTAEASGAVPHAATDGQAICLGVEGRLVLCGFPDKALLDEELREDRSLRPFSHPSVLKQFLFDQYLSVSSEYLIWNLSGKKYAYEELDGKIIEYDFPSRAILPFNVLHEVATAIHSWITSSPNNIAIVHDISGRRAAVVAACVLEISEYYPKESALRSVATTMGKAGNALVASQIRYYNYFCKARSETNFPYQKDRQLKLERVIVNGVPDFSLDNKLATEPDLGFCFPYLIVIGKTGDEIGRSTPSASPVFGKDISFNLIPTQTVLLQEDIVLRFLTKKDERDIAMFAISFHVGFVTEQVLRFKAQEIDGTARNPRFPKDMFVDVIFSDNIHTDTTRSSQSLPMNTKGDSLNTSKLLEQLEATDPLFTDIPDDEVDELNDILKEVDDELLSGTTKADDDSLIITKEEEKKLAGEAAALGTPGKNGSGDESATETPVEIEGVILNPRTDNSHEEIKKVSEKPLTADDVEELVYDSYQLGSTAIDTMAKNTEEEKAKKLSPIRQSSSEISRDIPSPMNIGDSVLQEIEAALGEEDFQMDDFEISDTDE